MHDYISSNAQSPNQKFQEKLKNPKNFEKPQNQGLKCMNAWKGRRLEHENWIAPHLYIDKCNSIDQGAIEIYWALNLDWSESIEVLLRICQWQKYLDGSKSCWEVIEKNSKNLDGLKLH